MSEHSIEELERQVQSARDRQRQAQQDVWDAESRLQKARNEQSGLVGHVLEFKRYQGYGQKAKFVTKRILVDTVKPAWRGTMRAFGKTILANGTVGLRRDDIDVTEATDCGPYVAPSA